MGKIGERLKKERERIGLSPVDFGDQCGVGQSAQYRYESGDRYPDGEYFAKAARIGVDILFVITGQKTPLAIRQETAGYTAAQRLAEFIAPLTLSEEDADMLRGLAQRLSI